MQDTFQHSSSAWRGFWEGGAFVDVAGMTENAQAFELERRTIQSMFLLRSQVRSLSCFLILLPGLASWPCSWPCFLALLLTMLRDLAL